MNVDNKSDFYAKGRGQGSRGIVLVMVLGILSVMVIMAVAFAVAMRTERVAAANAIDNVRIRALLDTALARAIEDIRLRMTNSVYPTVDVWASAMPSDYECASIGVEFDDYTNGAFIVQSGSVKRGLLYGEAADYVPRPPYAEAMVKDLEWVKYTNNLYAPLGSTTNIMAPRWIPSVEPASLIPEGTNVWTVSTNDAGVALTNVESRVLGRVGWVTINSSGFLDANFVGGLTHTNGTDPREISLANLLTHEVMNGDAFVLARNTDVRYDSLADLYQRQRMAGGLRFYPSNLFIYSYAMPGYLVGTNAPFTNVFRQVSLAGTAAELSSPSASARRAAIIGAFANMGFSLTDAGILLTNVLDYLDEDSIPRLPAHLASSESMPLLNELIISNSYTRTSAGGGQWTYAISNFATVEFAYPYATEQPPPHDTINGHINVTISGNDPWIPASTHTIPFVITQAVNAIHVLHNVPLGGFSKTTPPNPPANLIHTLNIGFSTFSAGILQQTSRVFTVSFTNYPAAAQAQQRLIMECIDPRMGGRADMWVVRPFATIGAINQVTMNYWVTNAGCDSNALFFTANGPMRSPAELGNLPIPNQPWRSISLFGTNLHPVLDVFAVPVGADPAAVYATNSLRGRVNINSSRVSAAPPFTLMREPLASVFCDVPVEDYPGGSVLGKLNDNDARLIAGDLASGPIMLNISDIGRGNLEARLAASSCGPLLQTRQSREALLGKVANLLTVRQNIFTIVLAAELAGQESGRIPRMPVRQRAVAIVWRDPYLNQFFVRSFRYLGD